MMIHKWLRLFVLCTVEEMWIDLRGIFEYIAFELQTPENVSGQLDRLEACILFYIFRMMIHKWLRLSVLCMVDEMWIRN